MIRLSSRIILMLILALFVALAAIGSPGDQLYVQDNTANIYKRPSTSAPILLQLEPGHKLIELQRQGPWVKVLISKMIGKEGWVQLTNVGPQAPNAGGDGEPESAVVSRPSPPSFGQGDKASTVNCSKSQDMPYEQELSSEITRARFHRNLNRKQLRNVTGTGSHIRIPDLADVNIDFGWKIAFSTVPVGDAFCLQVNRLELIVRHTPRDIFVAREYSRGSRQHRVALEHERKHIQIARATINRFIPRLNMVLTSLQIPTASRPIAVNSRIEGENHVRELIETLVEPLRQEIKAALKKALQKID